MPAIFRRASIGPPQPPRLDARQKTAGMTEKWMPAASLETLETSPWVSRKRPPRSFAAPAVLARFATMAGEITAQELKERLERGDDLIVLDVREQEEIALARMPRAVHIPMAEIPARLHELSRDREVVVVCHHGVRSAHVAQFLRQRQFDNVVNLAGGIDAWSSTVDPTVSRY
jgi:rhodanese-related sulfurtransferase